MKTTIKILIITAIAGLILSFGACSRKVIAPAVIEKTILKDSIVEVIRDSIITIPADSAWLKALLACDSIGNVYFKELLDYKAGKSVNPPKVIIKDNVITALSTTDSMNIYLTMKDRYQYTSHDNKKFEKEIVEVNRLTKMQSCWIVLGQLFGGILLIIIGFGSYKIYKFIF